MIILKMLIGAALGSVLISWVSIAVTRWRMWRWQRRQPAEQAQPGPGSAPQGVRFVYSDGTVYEADVLRDPDRDHDGCAMWIAVPRDTLPMRDEFPRIEADVLPLRSGLIAEMSTDFGGFVHMGHGPDGGCGPGCPAWNYL